MVYIYGASGHGKVVADLIEEAKPQNIAFIDDSFYGNSFNGYTVLNKLPKDNLEDASFIIAIGNNSIRKTVAEKLANVQFEVAVHPKAGISKFAKIGAGCVVMSNASINSHARIGIHGIINTNASIDHDCELGNYVHISPQAGLAGNVHIGDGTHVGIGASIIQGIKIGKWVTIGAGTIVINDVPDYAVVVGNPGKIIKYNEI